MRSVIPGSEGELAAAGVGPVPGGRDGPPAGACSSDAGPVMPENAEIHLKKSMANTQKKSEGSPSTLFSEDASKPVSRVLSFKTAIYLDAPLPVRSSRLPGTVGPTACPSTALLRIEFTAMGASTPSGELLPHLSTLTTDVAVSFSMALSLRLPSPDVIWHPALWSSDFPRVLWTRNRLSYLLQFSLS